MMAAIELPTGAFLGAYRFDGDPEELLAAHDRLMAGFPPDMIEFHVCIARPDGITIFDACPDEATFAGFSTSPEFRGALEGVGLPEPTVERLGVIHDARSKVGDSD